MGKILQGFESSEVFCQNSNCSIFEGLLEAILYFAFVDKYIYFAFECDIFFCRRKESCWSTKMFSLAGESDTSGWKERICTILNQSL